MGQIVDLSPTKIRKLAKAAEDGARLFPPGLKRNQMLALASHMRRLAAVAEMLRGRCAQLTRTAPHSIVQGAETYPGC
jgi:hypothetical protein